MASITYALELHTIMPSFLPRRLCALPFLLGLLGSNFALAGPSRQTLDCEIVIVGGGAGGLHTAFRLGPQFGAKVCLFEKDSELGGRIRDISLDTSDPAAPKMGVGARRIMETQNVVFKLAAELGLSLETPTLGTDLIAARGKTSFNKDDFAALYPGMPIKDDANTDQETWLIDRLRKGPERAKIKSYQDFRSYVAAVVTPAGLDYLRDMTRFRADFEYPLDARSYMDYLDEEWDVCCAASYPIGGMSAFIHAMEARALASGVRIFKSEAIQSIQHASKGAYLLLSKQHRIKAKQLVIAVPPQAFKWIKGDVAQEITRQSAFQDIIGVKVVTITQWWPDAWWKEIRNPAVTEANSQVWRAWTTESCINFIEIPLNPYAVAQNATRSVYNDNARCVDHWEQLAKTSMPQLEAEIHEGLSRLLGNNGVSEPQEIKIPAPLKTHVQIWPDAWHYLKAGATHSNAEIADWALAPLPGEPITMVGEAYFPNRSGWSDGAYKSSIRALNLHYGMSLSEH